MSQSASCHHEISDDWAFSLRGLVSIKAYNRECRPCVDFLMLCPKCLREVKRDGRLLKTEEEERAWMNSEGEP